MGTKGTSGKVRLGDKFYESLDGKKHQSENSIWNSRCMERCTTRLGRPLRIFQFFTTLLLFAMIVYVTAMPYRHLTDLAAILMIILTSSYLFFMAIDMISQFGSHGLPDSPMFLLSFLGMWLFAIAGGLMVHYPSKDNNFWALVLARALCFALSALFLIEITILLAYWRQKCLSWKKCYPYTPAGSCGQREIKTLFSREYPHDPDLEGARRRDLTTSISHNDIPIDTGMVDTAVLQHGSRKINVGYRRQYVDCHSSVPALSIQIAEIQTENGATSINECQTQRTDTREILVQTTSRCELCHRQMDDIPLSPNKYSPPPSVSLPTRYPSSPARSPVPHQLMPEPTQYSVPQQAPPIIPYDPQSQRGHCAVCPAMFHMMRGASPCCQSCNCGATGQSLPPIPYLLDQTSQQEPNLSHLSHWTEREVIEHTRRSTEPMKPRNGTQSPSTIMTAGKSDAERAGDLEIEEVNKYRPGEQLSRVYDTRSPDSPHAGAGLADKMLAESPGSATKMTLTSFSVRRNKRTQTPNKKNDSGPTSPRDSKEKDEGGDKIFHSSISKNHDGKEETANREKKEKVEDNKIESTITDHGRGESFGKIRNSSDIVEKIERLSDERVKKMSDVEIERLRRLTSEDRKSQPKKLYRDSQIFVNTIDPVMMDEKIDAREFKSMNSPSMEKALSDGEMLWKSERTENRESEPIATVDDWLSDELLLRTKEDSDYDDGEIDVEKTRFKMSFKKRFIKTDDPDNSSVESRARQKDDGERITHGAISLGRSGSTGTDSAPILRLRPERATEDFRIMRSEVEAVPNSRTTLRSRSREQMRRGNTEIHSSKTYSSEDPGEITSRSRRSENDVSKIIQSPESKKSLIFHEKSVNKKRAISESHSDLPDDEGGRFTDAETPVRLKEEEIRKGEYEIYWEERDQESSAAAAAAAAAGEKSSVDGIRKKFSTSRTVSRSISVVRDDEDDIMRISTEISNIDKVGKIIRSTESKESLMSHDEGHSVLSNQRELFGSRFDRTDEEFRFKNQQTPERLMEEEISEYDETTGGDDESEMEILLKISRSDVEKKFSTSSRAPSTRSMYGHDNEVGRSSSNSTMREPKSDEGKKYMKSFESKKRLVSSGRSVNIEREMRSESHSDRPDGETPTGMREAQTSEYGISERDEEYEIGEGKVEKTSNGGSRENQLSRSRRFSRTRTVVPSGGEGSKIISMRPMSKINRSSSSKKSLRSPQERSGIIERSISMISPKDSRGVDKISLGKEMPIKYSMKEDTSERDQEDEGRSDKKKSTPDDSIKFSTSSRVSTRKTMGKSEDRRNVSTRGSKSDASKIIQSSGSSVSFITDERSGKIDRDKSQSYSNRSRDNRESMDDETPTRLTEEEISEYETAQRDEKEIVEKSSVPIEFAKSSKISRTKSNVDGKKESKASNNARKDSMTRRGSSMKAYHLPGEKEKSSIVAGSPTRSIRETIVISSSQGETTRDDDDFAYVQTPWSSNVFRGTSRVDRRRSIAEEDENAQMSGDNYVETGPPARPVGQCMENSACQQSSGFFDIEYDGVAPVCTDDTICLEPCSCRIKSILLQQRPDPVQRQNYYHRKEARIERSSIRLSYENELLHKQYRKRQSRCPQGMLDWGCTRQRPQPENYYTTMAMRTTNNYDNSTQGRLRSRNRCYVS